VVVTRKPARMFVLDTDGGNVLAELEACGDADDVFTDVRRHLIYVSCGQGVIDVRSEEHTSELQSQSNLVCRLLLEKKKKIDKVYSTTYIKTHDSIFSMREPHTFVTPI